jgi:hypothetical protein
MDGVRPVAPNLRFSINTPHFVEFIHIITQNSKKEKLELP